IRLAFTYMKRKFRSERQALGKKKKGNAIRSSRSFYRLSQFIKNSSLGFGCIVLIAPACRLACPGYTPRIVRACVRQMTGIWKSRGIPKTLAFFPALSYIRSRNKIAELA
ncbi:hypothetical protein, partial [Brevibacillus parabrevis]|uniref:hypothetical protein n=2 Tax=Brevibacillus TaxID=55080 RepID=UPI003D1FFB00